MLDRPRDVDSGKRDLLIRLVPIMRLYASIAAFLGTLSSGSGAEGHCAFRVIVDAFELARPEALETPRCQVFDAVYCRLPILASTAFLPHMYTASFSPARHPARLAAQLLRAPPFFALSSSILATRFLNSRYWHFS